MLRSRISRAALPGLQVRQSTAAQALASRAHLEASLSTALALQSPNEYRRWLLAYARFLAEQGDSPRLGEVCSALLGSGSTAAAGGDAEMVDAEAAEGAAADGDEAAAAWQPTVLGLSKHELLGEVLKEMGRNRHLQRTTQSFLDALSDMKKAEERAAAAAEEEAAVPAAAAGPADPAPSPVVPAAPAAPAAPTAAAAPAAAAPPAPAPVVVAVQTAPPAPVAAAVPAAVAPAAPAVPAAAAPAAPAAFPTSLVQAAAQSPWVAALQARGVPLEQAVMAVLQATATQGQQPPST